MKIKILLLILLACALLFCSCGEGEASETPKGNYETKNLNVYNWGEYISDEDDEECGLFDVNAGFEEYFNEKLADKYGFYIKVNYSTYATNEDMYAKLTNSAVAYDIVIPSDYRKNSRAVIAFGLYALLLCFFIFFFFHRSTPLKSKSCERRCVQDLQRYAKSAPRLM